jgi:predicted secreted protein
LAFAALLKSCKLLATALGARSNLSTASLVFCEGVSNFSWARVKPGARRKIIQTTVVTQITMSGYFFAAALALSSATFFRSASSKKRYVVANVEISKAT